MLYFTSPTIFLDLWYVCKSLLFALDARMFALDDRYVCKGSLFDLDVNISVIGILTLVQTCHSLVSNRNILSGNGEIRCGFSVCLFLENPRNTFFWKELSHGSFKSTYKRDDLIRTALVC